MRPKNLAQTLSVVFEYGWERRFEMDMKTVQVHSTYDKVIDLLSQTLDPCSMMNTIEDASFAQDVTIGVESVTLQSGIIYYNNSDVTSKFSLLLTCTKNACISILYDYIEYGNKFIELISGVYGDYNDNYNYNYNSSDIVDLTVFNLFEKSLYISNLMLLSVAIPSEDIVNRNNKSQFDVYGVRIFDENLNTNIMIVNDTVTVKVDRNNTKIGRSSFANYYSGLNSVDVIITGFNRHKQARVDYVDNNHSSSILLTDYISITLLSDTTVSGSNTQLDSNISIIFEIDAFDIDEDEDGDEFEDEELKCVWLNWTDNSWSGDGCTLLRMVSDGDSVTCGCNHLTIFAILWNLDDYEENNNGDDDAGNPFWDEYANTPAYAIMLVVLILGFSMVVGESFRLLYKLHKNKVSLYSKTKPFEAAFGALFFIFVDSIVQIGSCVLFLSLVNFISNDNNGFNFDDSKVIINILIEFVTFLLFVPIIISFYIFSCVIYGLAIVSRSMSPNTTLVRKKILKFMIYTNIFITLLLIVMAVVLVTDVTKFSDMFHSIIFSIFECIYLLLVFITLILANYFAFGAIRVIHASIEMIRVEYGHKLKFRSQSITTNLDIVSGTRSVSVFDHSNESSQNISKENSMNQSNNVSANGIQKIENEMKQKIYKRYIAQQRMVISTIVLSIVLLIEILLLTTCLINPQLIHPIMQLFQMFVNWIYLIVTLKTYHHYIKARIDDKHREIQMQPRR